MIKKQTKNTYTQLEKILTVAGLTLVAVGCVANLYGAFTNHRFIHDPIDLMYYFRYVILLGGGFAVGYLLTKKPSDHKLLAGVFYAVLAIALFWLFDLARFSLQNLFGYAAPYPWGKIMFEGMPVLSVIAALLVAYFSQYKTNRSDVSTFTKVALITSFIAYQVYILANGAYYLITGGVTYTPNMPIWLIVGSYLLTPLVIAIVAYLLLNNIQKRFDRLVYAALIGTFYSTLTFVLWEFRTEALYEATNIFSSVVTALTVLFAGVLIWRARKAIK
jgi:hypothetical protein